MRDDVRVQPDALRVNLKWSKNMQASSQPKHIFVPTMSKKQIDPVSTYVNMCRAVPAQPTDPLFMLPNGNILTISVLRQQFKVLCTKIGLDAQKFSIHSLRRGGASHAHHAGAQSIDIQRHGAWASQVFWDYVVPLDHTKNSVSSALRV